MGDRFKQAARLFNWRFYLWICFSLSI